MCLLPAGGQEQQRIGDEQQEKLLARQRHRAAGHFGGILQDACVRTWDGIPNSEHILAFVPHDGNARSLQRSSVGNDQDDNSQGHRRAGVKGGNDSSRTLKGAKGKDSFSPYEGGPYSIGIEKKSKKGKGKGKGGSYPRPTPRPTPHPVRHPTPRPTVRPTPPPVPRPTPPPSGGGEDCRIPMNIDFLQLAALTVVFVDPGNPNAQDIGTTFIYNDAVFNQTSLDEVAQSRASGTCTRIQNRIEFGGGDFQPGGGHCVFSYSLFDGNNVITFSAAGDIFDAAGGILPITGGANGLRGAYGEILLEPVNYEGGRFVRESGDIFQDPLGMLADATIFMPCP
jgi:hypothetical protein